MLSGLESAVCLEELHVAKQRLPRGQRFAIDQASINGIKVVMVVFSNFVCMFIQIPDIGPGASTTEYGRRLGQGSCWHRASSDRSNR